MNDGRRHVVHRHARERHPFSHVVTPGDEDTVGTRLLVIVPFSDAFEAVVRDHDDPRGRAGLLDETTEKRVLVRVDRLQDGAEGLRVAPVFGEEVPHVVRSAVDLPREDPDEVRTRPRAEQVQGGLLHLEVLSVNMKRGGPALLPAERGRTDIGKDFELSLRQHLPQPRPVARNDRCQFRGEAGGIRRLGQIGDLAPRELIGHQVPPHRFGRPRRPPAEKTHGAARPADEGPQRFGLASRRVGQRPLPRLGYRLHPIRNPVLLGRLSRRHRRPHDDGEARVEGLQRRPHAFAHEPLQVRQRAAGHQRVEKAPARAIEPDQEDFDAPRRGLLRRPAPAGRP